jgi:chromosome segregation ATPase
MADTKYKKDDLVEALRELHEKQDKQTEAIMDIKIAVVKSEVILDSHLKEEEKLAIKIDSMDDRLSEYNKLLSVHIEGVNQLKLTNELLKQDLDQTKVDIDERLKKVEEPIQWRKETKTRIYNLAKLITAISTIGVAVMWIITKLKH